MTDTASAAKEKAAVKPAPRKLLASRFKHAEILRNVWAIVPEAGTPYEAVKDKGFLAHVARMIKPSDRIEVIAEDGSYFAELIVRASGPDWVEVSELRKVELSEIQVSDDSAFKVEWKGPHLKFCVIRTSDGVSVQTGFAEKTEAAKWAAVASPSVHGAAA